MEYRNDLQIKQYIKQLEDENLLLKQQLLNCIKYENSEIVRLKFKVNMLETENKKLLNAIAHNLLFGN